MYTLYINWFGEGKCGKQHEIPFNEQLGGVNGGEPMPRPSRQVTTATVT